MDPSPEKPQQEIPARSLKVRLAWWFGIYVAGICYYAVLTYFYGDINFRLHFTFNPLVYLFSLAAPLELTAEWIEQLLNEFFRHPGQGVYNVNIARTTAVLLYLFHLSLSLYLKKSWLFAGMLGILMLLLLLNTPIVMEIITD